MDGGGVGDPDSDPNQEGQDVGAVVTPETPEGVADDAPAPLGELLAPASQHRDAEDKQPNTENLNKDILSGVHAFLLFCPGFDYAHRRRISRVVLTMN